MKKIEALAWMVKQIYANELESEKQGIVERCAGNPKEIHVYKGCATLADAIGAPFTVTEKPGSEYPVVISFNYEGYTFFQMEKDIENATDICNT